MPTDRPKLDPAAFMADLAAVTEIVETALATRPLQGTWPDLIAQVQRVERLALLQDEHATVGLALLGVLNRQVKRDAEALRAAELGNAAPTPKDLRH